MRIDWFPLWLSLRVAALATLLALPLALWLAHLLTSHRFRGKDLLKTLISLPLILPSTVLAYYLIVLLSKASPLGRLYEAAFGTPLLFTWQAAVAAALFHTLPLLVRSSQRAFEITGRDCLKAARGMGASEWRIFWSVTLPGARSFVTAAALLAFARALGDFGITIMIAGNLPGQTQTLPVAVYSAAASGDGTTARALVLAVSALILGLLFLSHQLEPKQVVE
jgi:molybdate transport system permease protein